MRRLEQRNLSHLVANYFLHDDVVTNNQATNDAVQVISVIRKVLSYRRLPD